MKKFYLVTKEASLLEHPLVQALKEKSLIVSSLKEADKILVMGGDGTMLTAIRDHQKRRLPFCGLNFGHIGFLMNEPTEKVLSEIIEEQTQTISVRLLKAQLYDQEGTSLGEEFAFNEFYMEKAELLQTAKIRVTINKKLTFDPLICNGVLVCTQAGSTAYNAAAGGEVLPIHVEAMVITGIAPAVFHRWRTGVLSNDAEIIFEAVETAKRPVIFVADNKALPGVAKAVIRYSAKRVRLEFAESQNFREKSLKLKF